MKKAILTSFALSFVLFGCSAMEDDSPSQDFPMNNGHMRGGDDDDRGTGGMNNRGMGGGMMNHGNAPRLDPSAGITELIIPPVLEKQQGEEFDYAVTAQQGSTDFFEGTSTDTYGYNGNLLGPTIRLQQGESVDVKITNDLDEPTTFHWHGLEVPGDIDGGPHGQIEPGDSQIITLEADQPAATLWYHPHVHGATAEQVFKGLSGMLFIDEATDSGLPNDYGVDDIPLIFQDRLFDENQQLNYNRLMDIDGTMGDISMVNGTIDPKLTVTEPVMRFRLLNGANARNYTFRLSNGADFTQIDAVHIKCLAVNRHHLRHAEQLDFLGDRHRSFLFTQERFVDSPQFHRTGRRIIECYIKRQQFDPFFIDDGERFLIGHH